MSGSSLFPRRCSATSSSWTFSAHTGRGRAACNQVAGTRFDFLPAYNPGLSPIEQVFAKLKHILCKATERSVEATW